MLSLSLVAFSIHHRATRLDSQFFQYAKIGSLNIKFNLRVRLLIFTISRVGATNLHALKDSFTATEVEIDSCGRSWDSLKFNWIRDSYELFVRVDHWSIHERKFWFFYEQFLQKVKDFKLDSTRKFVTLMLKVFDEMLSMWRVCCEQYLLYFWNIYVWITMSLYIWNSVTLHWSTT